jgi:hypothetical protein
MQEDASNSFGLESLYFVILAAHIAEGFKKKVYSKYCCAFGTHPKMQINKTTHA